MTPEDVLQWCLEEIEAGRLTVAECAAQFPEIPDLAEHLRLAQILTRWRKPEMAAQAELAWQAKLRRAVRARAVRGRPHGWHGWRRPVLRWGLALAVAALPLVGSAGLVSASAGSVPGDTLYGVKRAAELARLVLTPAEQQAELHVVLAETRAAELSTVVARGAPTSAVVDDLSTEMLSEVEVALTQSQTAAQVHRTELLQRLIAGIANQQAALAAAQAQAQGAAQASLNSLLAASQEQAARAQVVLSQAQAVAEITATLKPSDGAPTATEVMASSTPTVVATDKTPGVPSSATSPAGMPTIVTITPLPRKTPAPTITASSTPRATLAPTSSPTVTNTLMSPTTTATTAATTTATETAWPTITPSVTSTASPTDTPTLTQTPTPTETETETPTSTPTVTVTATDTPEPSTTPGVSATPEPSTTPTPGASTTEAATNTPPELLIIR